MTTHRVAALRATNREVDSCAAWPDERHGVNDFGSGPHGTSASEIPPMTPNYASAAGGPDRVSDPIPFRRPVIEPAEELHVADPLPQDDLAATTVRAPEPEPVLGPTGRPLPNLR